MSTVQIGLGRSAAPAFPAPADPAPRRLAPIERQVIHLSRRDGAASLLTRKAPAARLRRLIGLASPNGLADPRLEALRRYAVLLRHGGDRLAEAARAELRDHGFGEEQIMLARWLVAREPASKVGGMNWAMLIAVVLLALATAGLAVVAIGEPGVAAILGLLAFVTVAPLAALGKC